MDKKMLADALDSIETKDWGPYRTEILHALRGDVSLPSLTTGQEAAMRANATTIRDNIIEECARECEKARFHFSTGPMQGYPVNGLGEHFAECLRALKRRDNSESGA